MSQKPAGLQMQEATLQRFAGGKMIQFALVRLYRAVETSGGREWRLEHSGPVVLTNDGAAENPYVIRVLEMPSGRIVHEQRISPEIQYRSLQSAFHSWDGPEEVQGMSFAQETDSASFLENVQKASRGEVLTPAPPARSARAPAKPGPPPVPPRDDLPPAEQHSTHKSSAPPRRAPPPLPIAGITADDTHPNPPTALQPSPKINSPPLSTPAKPTPGRTPALAAGKPPVAKGVPTLITMAVPSAASPAFAAPAVASPRAHFAAAAAAPAPPAPAASAPPSLTRDRSKTEPEMQQTAYVESGTRSIGRKWPQEGKRAHLKQSIATLFGRGGKKNPQAAAEATPISGPSGFRHESHIGWDPEKGFQINNIPNDWQRVFAAAGIKKHELQNPETAAFVMSIVSANAPPSSMPSGPSPSIDPNVNASITESQSAPNHGPAIPARPHRAAPPPPAPSAAPAAPAPPPPPRVASAAASSGSAAGTDLLSSIRQGKELRHVVVPDLGKMNTDENNHLVGVLQNAMSARRCGVEEAGDDDDDWALEA